MFTSPNDDMKIFADNLWEYFKPMLTERLEHNIGWFRAVVTANPGGGKLTIQRPFDEPFTVKCTSSMSGASVGDNVLVFSFGENLGTNAIVVGTADGANIGGGAEEIPLPIAKGGTGATATPTAFNNLAGEKGLVSPYGVYSFNTNTTSVNGYRRIATVTITGTYAAYPIEFEVFRYTDAKPVRLFLQFAAQNTTDPTLNGFWYDDIDGSNGSSGRLWFSAFVYKTATSTWDVYARGAATTDAICTKTTMSRQMQTRCDVSYSNAQLTSVPSGATIASKAIGAFIPDNTDLNTVTMGSQYRSASASNATSLLNCPTGSNFGMSVFDRNIVNRPTQIIYDYNNRVFGRTRLDDTTWSAWQLFAGPPLDISSKYTFTRTGGTAGSAGAVTAYRDGNVVHISLVITTTAATASGSNLFTGTLSGGPMPIISIRLFSYVGGIVVLGDLSTSGSFTVRACGGSCPATSYNMIGTFITSDAL